MCLLPACFSSIPFKDQINFSTFSPCQWHSSHKPDMVLTEDYYRVTNFVLKRLSHFLRQLGIVVFDNCDWNWSKLRVCLGLFSAVDGYTLGAIRVPMFVIIKTPVTCNATNVPHRYCFCIIVDDFIIFMGPQWNKRTCQAFGCKDNTR